MAFSFAAERLSRPGSGYSAMQANKGRQNKKEAARALAVTSERPASQRAIISPHLERNPRE